MNRYITSSSATELFMFYNLENLFYPADRRSDRGHRFDGMRNWTKGRYLDKLYKIADVFSMVQEKYGVLPSLAGVCEVEGEQPLKDLLALQPFDSFFDYVHFDSLDERGIDVALIYNRMTVKILDSETITFIFEIPDENPENYDTTRDVLYCHIQYLDRPMHLYILHLPSKRERDINRPKRDYILNELKKDMQKRSTEHNEPVIVMGDFNTNPDDEGIQELLNVNENIKLVNYFLNVYENRIFSTFHYANGLLFDQIIISETFFSDQEIRFQKAEVFTTPQMMSKDRRFLGRPYRTYAGSRYLGGYSDHFPVLIEFEKKPYITTTN